VKRGPATTGPKSHHHHTLNGYAEDCAFSVGHIRSTILRTTVHQSSDAIVCYLRHDEPCDDKKDERTTGPLGWWGRVGESGGRRE